MAGLSLQLGHPKIRGGPLHEVLSVPLAIQLLFRKEEESAYLYWHDIPIRFRYKQDLSRCFDNILAMAWLMQRDERGATKVDLETQLLTIRWEVRWEVDSCHVHSVWEERDALFEPYAAALNRIPDLHTSKSAFLCEWKTLLHQIIVSIEAGGVVIRDGVERRKWEMLQRVEREIAQYGTIYTRV